MSVLHNMIGFLVTTDTHKSKHFFGETLGFPLINEDDFGMTFNANGSRLRLVKATTFVPAAGTVLGWNVQDVHAAIRELTAKGVRFEQFDLPYMKQDAYGVWDTEAGDKVAWFKDPEGNVLSVSQHDM
ncbi:MAG: VOC family protein [Gemmatimonadota bacterium]|nr:VOC family protein [Gemmatimonadota bacterium]